MRAAKHLHTRICRCIDRCVCIRPYIQVSQEKWVPHLFRLPVLGGLGLALGLEDLALGLGRVLGDLLCMVDVLPGLLIRVVFAASLACVVV